MNHHSEPRPVSNRGFFLGLLIGAIVGAVIAIILCRKDKDRILAVLKEKVNLFLKKPTPKRMSRRTVKPLPKVFTKSKVR